jgi:hypothetical protein
MKHLRQLLTRELRIIGKQGEIPKLENIASRLEKVDGTKVSPKNAMNLREIAQELDKLSKGSLPAGKRRLNDISKILLEKATEMELAEKAVVKKNPIEEIVDKNLILITENTSVTNFSPQTRNLMEKVVTKAARVAGEKIGERLSVSARKIARYEGRPVDENHVNLAIRLLDKRVEKAQKKEG